MLYKQVSGGNNSAEKSNIKLNVNSDFSWIFEFLKFINNTIEESDQKIFDEEGNINIENILYNFTLYSEITNKFGQTGQGKADLLLFFSLLGNKINKITDIQNYYLKMNKVVKILLASLQQDVSGSDLMKHVAQKLWANKRESIYNSQKDTIDKVLDSILNNEGTIGDCFGLTTLFSIILYQQGKEFSFAKYNLENSEERHVRMIVEGKEFEVTLRDLLPGQNKYIKLSESPDIKDFISELLFGHYLNQSINNNQDKYNLLHIFRDQWEGKDNINKRIKHVAFMLFASKGLLNQGISQFDPSEEIIDQSKEYEIRIRFSLAELVLLLENGLSAEQMRSLDDISLYNLLSILNLINSNQEYFKNFYHYDYNQKDKNGQIINKHPIDILVAIYNSEYTGLNMELRKRYLTRINFYILQAKENEYKNQQKYLLDMQTAFNYAFNLWNIIKNEPSNEIAGFLKLCLNNFLGILGQNADFKNFLREVIELNKTYGWITDKKVLKIAESYLK